MSEPASGAPYQALAVDDDQTSAVSASPTDDDVDNRPVSPRRNDIWNQPWWLFFLMVLLFLGLIAASISVHVAVCSAPPPPETDPVRPLQFTTLRIGKHLVDTRLGTPSNQTEVCSMESVAVSGAGPTWAASFINIPDDILEAAFVLGNDIARETIVAGFGGLPAAGDTVAVGPSHARMLWAGRLASWRYATAGWASVRIHAGATDRIFVPIVIAGANIPDEYGAVESARDVLFFLEDACPSYAPSCTCSYNGSESARYGAVFVNGRRRSRRLHEMHVDPDSRVRLRVMNGAGGTNFQVTMRADDDKVVGTIVAVDGQWIQPVPLASLNSTVFVGVGQRLDIVISIPKRRWTRVELVAVEEGRGDQPRHQTGLVLLTEQSPWASAHDVADLPLVSARVVYDDWGAERVYRRLDAKHAGAEQTSATIVAANATAVMRLSANNTINGYKYDDKASVVYVRLGSTLAITFANDIVDEAVPVHIDGHWFTVVAFDGVPVVGAALRDTLLIPARRNATVAIQAVNPGRFQVACLNEIRRQRGMATTLQYIV